MIYSVLRVLLLISALGVTTLAPALFPPDVSGVWKIDFINEAATESVMVTLAQQDSTLTGHYLGYFDVSQLAGSMQGKELSFSYNIDGTMIHHFGRLKGNMISGSYNAGEFEQGYFKATRIK